MAPPESRPLTVATVASEFAPFAKTGGLADVTTALTDRLHRDGHDVRMFLPLYRRVRDAGLDIVPVDFARNATMRVGPWSLDWSLCTARVGDAGQPIYLIDCPALFDRPDLYGDGADEHVRFIGLSRMAIESCQRMGFSPDVFHVNDWQAALVPVLLRTTYAWDALFQRTKTALTIHNIGYQGAFPADILDDTGLREHARALHQEDLARGVINFLKTGILYADVLTTVSPTYADEIQTERYGAGLHGLLRKRRDHLVGILNGVDYATWDPRHDAKIPYRYGPGDMAGKAENKRALLEAMGLPHDPSAPTFGVVSRLAYQKGFDLFFETMPAFLAANDVRLVVLGSGEAKYAGFFARLQQAFPGRVSFYHGYSDELAHRIEAGADFFLMPSRYEPCGLNQMYSLRYGTPPIVRKTGGLADTVQLYNPRTGAGNGVVFERFGADAFRWALGYALDVWRDPASRARIVENAMAADYSWERQARKYVALFHRLASR